MRSLIQVHGFGRGGKNVRKAIEAEYLTSINIHSPMEPMNALALEKDGICHIYTGNQFNTRTTAIAAATAGVDRSPAAPNTEI